MADSEFTAKLEQAVNAARQAANQEAGGDPGTMASFSVDGRCGFARTFKQEADQDRGKYTIRGVPVSLDDDNGLHLDVLEGTDIQLHSKKIAAYRAFAREMETQGYSVGLDVNTYSY